MENKDIVRKPVRSRNSYTWAIRGIEPATRTAATMAARRAGQTVGEWCNLVLMEAATSELKTSVPGPTIEQTVAQLVEAMGQQNALFAARLEAMEQRQKAQPAATTFNPFAWLWGGRS